MTQIRTALCNGQTIREVTSPTGEVLFPIVDIVKATGEKNLYAAVDKVTGMDGYRTHPFQTDNGKTSLRVATVSDLKKAFGSNRVVRHDAFDAILNGFEQGSEIVTDEPEKVIRGVNIRYDDRGRYSLVDLCTAFGSTEKKDEPNRWHNTAYGQAAVSKVRNKYRFSPIQKAMGQPHYGGTTAVKELCVSYACWLSHDFGSEVAKAFGLPLADTRLLVRRAPYKKRGAAPEPEVMVQEKVAEPVLDEVVPAPISAHNEIVAFPFDAVNVRVIVDDAGDPWFVAADVAQALGYDHPPHMARMLDPDEKGVHAVDTLGGQQGLAVINESGLYACILKSRRDEAKRFKKWVTSEVLPTLRKTGTYTMPVAPAATPVLDFEKAKLELLREAHMTAQAVGFSGNHALIYADNYVRHAFEKSVLAGFGATHLLADQRGKTYNPTELGQMMSPTASGFRVNRRLYDAGLQETDLTGAWVPTAKAAGLYEWVDVQKSHGEGTPVKQLRWFKEVLEQI